MEFSRFPFAIIILFVFSVYGWGRFCKLFCDRRLFRFHTIPFALGLALLNVAGGVLNLFGLAKSWTLLSLMLSGAALGAFELVRLQPWRGLALSKASIPVWVALGFALSAGAWLAPSEIFNIGDDFHTYAVRAVRMTQTGSVGGNAFDPLGLDSLGSQSFFHAFFLQGSDIRMLNGFDAVICFAFSLLLIAELSIRWRLHWFTGTLAVLCTAVINPQYVNISPVYSGALGIMSLLICGVLLARTLASNVLSNRWRSELSLGLIFAWLITLKVTLAVFAGCFLGTLYLLLLFKAKAVQRRTVFQSGFIVAGFTGIFVLPWALISLPTILKARELAAGLHAQADLATKYSSLSAHNIPAMFSMAPTFYGNRPLSFFFVILVVGVAGLIAFLRRGANRNSSSGSLILAVGITLPVTYLAFGHLFPAETAVRYLCPSLIGAFAVTVLCFVRLTYQTVVGEAVRQRWALSSCLVGVIVLFGGTFWGRVRMAATNRTLLAFPTSPEYKGYSRGRISPFEAEYYSSIQTNMAPGARALVFTVAPFQMDFTRNELLTASITGIINPQLHFPAGADGESFQRYLRSMGVRYVLMETDGYAVPKSGYLEGCRRSRFTVDQKIGDFGLYLRQTLLELSRRNRICYSDDRMVLYELKDSPVSAQTENGLNQATPQNHGKIY
ncbi:hypothetical protein [Pedosphaera parvula]|uniref:Glycosyltransferase RgtA/B/C/D-like domain-containing protein n=1 Tax=Pedosphaera parvula (strain Ellin514) TaxID=320771 RepID=B9XJT7_PEDPL|nr:hypothetical protein [Pedosphaera parvula]EEF59963.1 hypothetical protein Cflav_PD2767 [Pedosphaera parvula Ellin514]